MDDITVIYHVGSQLAKSQRIRFVIDIQELGLRTPLFLHAFKEISKFLSILYYLPPLPYKC